ncbi:MAG: hypothetical protein U1F70_02015 [Candidatus Competibacteraceae bacterium]
MDNTDSDSQTMLLVISVGSPLPGGGGSLQAHAGAVVVPPMRNWLDRLFVVEGVSRIIPTIVAISPVIAPSMMDDRHENAVTFAVFVTDPDQGLRAS